MSNFISVAQIVPDIFPGHLSYKCLNELSECVNGCCAGMSIYNLQEFQAPGIHEDQECFYVLEGIGEVIIDDSVHKIKQGMFFVVHAGQAHSIRTSTAKPIKLIWFHAAIR